MHGAFTGIVAASHSLFSPTSIAGLLAWYKADSLALTDGNSIAAWSDSSGNGHTATTGGTSQPIYKTAIIGGKPVARFDGGDDFLSISPAIGTAGESTVIAVGSRVSTGTNFVSIGSTVGFTWIGFYYFDDKPTSGDDGNGFLFGSPNSAIGPMVFTVTRTAYNVMNAYINSTSIGSMSGGSGMFSAMTFNLIGERSVGSIFHSGDLAEILIYNSCLGATDQVNVENYLRSKYGL